MFSLRCVQATDHTNEDEQGLRVMRNYKTLGRNKKAGGHGRLGSLWPSMQFRSHEKQEKPYPLFGITGAVVH